MPVPVYVKFKRLRLHIILGILNALNVKKVSHGSSFKYDDFRSASGVLQRFTVNEVDKAVMLYKTCVYAILMKRFT